MTLQFDELALSSPTGRIFHCAWRPGTRELGEANFAAASEDGTAILWDLSRRKGSRQVAVLRGHGDDAEVLRVAFSGSRWFATGGADGAVNLYRVSDLKARTSMSAGRPHRPAAARLEHKHEAVADGEGQVYGVIFPKVETSAKSATSASENALLTCVEDTVFSWDLGASGGVSVCSSFSFAAKGGSRNASRAYGGAVRNPGGSNLVFDLSALPPSLPGCESLFAAALSDGTAAVVDTRSGEQCFRLGSHSRHCTCVAVRGARYLDAVGAVGAVGAAGASAGSNIAQVATTGAAGDILVHDLRFPSSRLDGINGMPLSTAMGASPAVGTRTAHLRCRLGPAHERAVFGCLWLERGATIPTPSAATASDALLSWSADGTVRWQNATEAGRENGDGAGVAALRPSPRCRAIYWCAASADGRLAFAGEAEEEEGKGEGEAALGDEKSPFAIPAEFAGVMHAGSVSKKTKGGGERERRKVHRGAVYISKV